MSLVEVLALWGAVFGTIGTITGALSLWLRFKQYDLDKAKLSCEAFFGFSSYGQAEHIVVVRSIGRRPVVLDAIRYYYRPAGLAGMLLSVWRYRRGQWMWIEDLNIKVNLNEGEKSELKIFESTVTNVFDICRAEVVDQTGKSWPVRWQSRSQLRRIATKELLDEFFEENSKRSVLLQGDRLGNKYFLRTEFNNKPKIMGRVNGRGFWFMTRKEYQKKLEEVKLFQAEKFLLGDIEEIE